MIAGFNISLKELNFDEPSFIDIDTNTQIKESLDKFILPNKIADGTKIEDEWFPQIEADVFISHSHADEELAKTIAYRLKHQCGLTCFIDSQVWGYCDTLLEEINTNFSDKIDDGNGGIFYTHSKCNTASQHVNLMLATALQKMLEKTPFIFFLNTPQSLEKYSEVYDTGTYSPWIYYELVTTNSLLKTCNELRKSIAAQENFSGLNESYKALYNVPTNYLADLNLKLLFDNCDTKDKSFDFLINIYASHFAGGDSKKII